MSIESFKMVRRYAQAYLNVFAPRPSLEVLTNFERCMNFIKTNHDMVKKLSSLVTDDAIQLKAFSLITDDYALDHGSALIKVLISNKHLTLLYEVLGAIIAEGRIRRNEFLCNVISSHPLQDSAREELEDALEKKLLASVVCTYSQDSTLLDGILVKSSTFLWEDSLAKKLRHYMSFIAKQD